MSFRLRSGIAATLLCLLLPTSPAGAQSAADKATARQLAIQGVEAYRKKDYAGALGKLSRAQNLYDAPVHLVYIARASAKLGKLVEAAEAYRKLVRTRLGAGAPDAFREAVEDGKKELPELEPRIPKLRIDVEPADIEGLEVKVGESQVPVAALGANRPTNPGDLVVTASAPGYADGKQSLKLAEGETKAIKIVLEENADGGGGGAAGAGGSGSGGEGGGSAGKAADPGGLGFVLSVRLAGVTPSGTAFTTSAPGVGGFGDQEIAMADLYGPGGGGELRGGVRFLRYFTGHLVAGLYQLKSGEEFDKVATPLVSMNAESEARLGQFGVGVAVGTPPGKLGAFGELDFMLVHSFATTRSLEGDKKLPTAVNCEEEWVASGRGLRLAGGVNIPLSKSFQLTPMLGVTFGGFSDFEVSGCDEGGDRRSPDTFDEWKGKNPTEDPSAYPLIDGLIIDKQERDGTTHTVGFLGIGIDWLFGADIPSK